MQLRPEFQIKAVVKALTDTVLPAVDAGNAQAVEQLQLAIATLGFVAQRLPLQFEFDRDELQRLCGLAEQLGAAGADAVRVDDALEHARDVLARAAAAPGELERAVQRLRRTTAAAVTSAAAGRDAVLRDAVARAVLAHAAAQLERDRAWVKPQGWEADPQAVPDIENLLGES